MQKILIADASCELCESVAKQLGTQCLVTYCNDGQKVIELVNNTEPDVLVLDLALPTVDGITILKMLRSAGKNIPVLVMTTYLNDYVVSNLQDLYVCYVCRKPCSVEALVCSIRALSNDEDSSPWIPETEVDNILILLGFQMGPLYYENVRTAILLKFRGEAGSMSKCLYPAVAARHGKNGAQVEKSIRDAIRRAFLEGDRNRWILYFPSARQNQYPSNDVFITRIAYALQTRERMPKPPAFPLYKTENK